MRARGDTFFPDFVQSLELSEEVANRVKSFVYLVHTADHITQSILFVCSVILFVVVFIEVRKPKMFRS